jgi:hypothetical protein
VALALEERLTSVVTSNFFLDLALSEALCKDYRNMYLVLHSGRLDKILAILALPRYFRKDKNAENSAN